LEAEAHDRVGDGLAGPVRHDQVDIRHARHIVGPLLPDGVEVIVAAPVEIAHIVHDQPIAVDRCCGGAGNIRCPVAVAGGLDGRPPRQDDDDDSRIGG
jgi:hypothetical protein